MGIVFLFAANDLAWQQRRNFGEDIASAVRHAKKMVRKSVSTAGMTQFIQHHACEMHISFSVSSDPTFYYQSDLNSQISHDQF